MTFINNDTVASSGTSPLAAATFQEQAVVLEQLLAAHPELVAEATDLISAELGSAIAKATADEVADQLGCLGFDDLANRAGRIPGRGYVHETDAAWELLEEAFEPFLADIGRRADLGFIEAAASIASGTIAGLGRLRQVPDGQLIAFVGDDAVDTFTATVLDLTDDLGIELELDTTTDQN